MNPSLNAALSVMENHWRAMETGYHGDPMLFEEDALKRLYAISQGMFNIIERASTQHAAMRNGKPSYTVHTGEALRTKLRQQAIRDRN